MEHQEKIGERIRNIRKKREMTVEALGNQIGVDKATITRYERGYVKKISRMNLEGIAKALGVPISYLLEDVDVEVKLDRNGEALEKGENDADEPYEYRVIVSDMQMAPRMKMGDTLYCVKESMPKDETVAMIRKDEEILIRNIKIVGDAVIMTSDNPSVPVLTASISDFESGEYFMVARVVRMEARL